MPIRVLKQRPRAPRTLASVFAPIPNGEPEKVITVDPTKKTIVHILPFGIYLGGGERLISEWGKHIPDDFECFFFYLSDKNNYRGYDFGKLRAITYSSFEWLNKTLIQIKPTAIVDHGSAWDVSLYEKIYAGVNSKITFYLHGCELFKRINEIRLDGNPMNKMISNYTDPLMKSIDGEFCVAPLQIDVNKFKFVERDYKKPLRVGIIGRISEEKIPKSFLQKLFHYKNPAFEFHIIGIGLQYGDFVKNQIKSYKHIKYLGGFTPSEMPEVYLNLDLILSPSLSETGGYAIMEAMSTGLPVISRNTGALPETVASGGIVCNDNDDELLKALSLFENIDFLKAMSKKARKKIEMNNSSPEKQFAKLNQFIIS